VGGEDGGRLLLDRTRHGDGESVEEKLAGAFDRLLAQVVVTDADNLLAEFLRRMFHGVFVPSS
jgi:hypothetical protein